MEDVKKQSSTNKEETQVGNYILTRILGEGTYGKVRLGEHIHTKEQVAIKVIEKSNIQNKKQIARIQREIRFLKLLHHPNIVQVYDVEETNSHIYIVMEYAVGGELFDYIVAHKRLREKEARGFFRMMISAVDYCHQNSVIHRDLKPENLLLDSKKQLRIIDFGFGNTFRHDKFLETFCGSPFYAAPEMILGKRYLGPEVDMWSLGVILFALLCGRLPFDDENMKELYKNISSGNYACPDYLGPGARHLIGRLLTVDPKRRGTLSEVMMHEWVLEGFGHPPENHLPRREPIRDPSGLDKDIVQRLATFNYQAEEVYTAFFVDDLEKTNPVRSTYYLLVEMMNREEAKALKKTEEAQEKSAVMQDPMGTRRTSRLPGPDIKRKGVSLISMFPSIQERYGEMDGTIDQDQQLSASAERQLNLSAHDASVTSQGWDGPQRNIGHDPLGGAQFHSMPTFQEERDASPTPPSINLTRPRPGEQRKNGEYPQLHQTGRFANRATTLNLKSRPQSCVSTVPPVMTLAQGPRSAPEGEDSTARRFSVQPGASDGISAVQSNAPTPPSPSASVPQIRKEPRSVLGWFLNVSTTSRKEPHEIMREVERVLDAQGVQYKLSDAFTLDCEYKGGTNGKSKSINGDVGFQIEVCRVPRLSLHGLHFRRQWGGVWDYKSVCNHLLSSMAL